MKLTMEFIAVIVYFVACGATEGWKWEMLDGKFGDTSPLIRDDGKRPFGTYHHYRLIMTLAVSFMACMLLGWVAVPLLVGCDRLYTRMLVWVEYHDLFHKQPDFIFGKIIIKRWPVWVDFVIIYVCIIAVKTFGTAEAQ